MRLLTAALLSLAILIPTGGMRQSAETRAGWNRPAEPFRLYGDVYYVGTAGLSSFLIRTPEGLILIDGGLPESAPLIARNIQALGFRLGDIKYLLINHAHVDHAGGLAELKRLTGATLLAGEGDQAILETGGTNGRTDISGFPAVQVDRVVQDGDRLSLGGVVLTAVATPGHTPGATSWVMEADGKRVLFLSSISVAGQRLVEDPAYPQAAGDFQRTFARLRTERADIVLGFHTEGYDLVAKRARLMAGDEKAFVDPEDLARHVVRAASGFDDALRAQTSDPEAH